MRARLLVVLLAGLTGCAGLSPARRAALEADAQPALLALQAARFEEARTLATGALQREPENSRAAGVSALALYRQTLADFATDAMTMVATFAVSAVMRGDVINKDFLAFMLDRTDGRLKEVDGLLATAGKDSGFNLELCLACWEVDWNRSGELDARDRHLLEIELDAAGQPLPEDDVRRRPTFRFDVADVEWLRAMVHFQRAVLALGGAYDPNVTFASRHQEQLQLKVRDPKKLLEARELALAGLAHAATCRQLVLAETDDDREWLPHPRQKSHPIPLEVDDALFETWAGVLSDVEKLLRGQEGVSVADLLQLGKRPWENPPGGFVDVGALLTQPRDLAFSEVDLRVLRRDNPGAISEYLGRLLGPAYKAQLPPSGLLQRLKRVRKELDLGEDTAERKLRYLLWLN